MNLILFGPPGAGKGTQGEIICEALQIPTISTGAMIRAAIQEGTDLGRQVEDLTKAGLLVPDEIVVGLVQERLTREDCRNGFILDGFPRTIPQAKALEKLGVRIDCVLDIEVPDDVIVERMSGRRSCPSCGATYHVTFHPSSDGTHCDLCAAELTQRADDRPETVRARLQVYHEQTEPLRKYYLRKHLLTVVDGRNGVEETANLVKEALGI